VPPPRLRETLKVPLPNELAPDDFFYGGNYILEFSADSLWRETLTVEYAEKVRKAARGKSNRWVSTPSNPLNVAESAVRWKRAARTGFSAEDKRQHRLDDNTAIFLQRDGEKEFIDVRRIGALPYGIRARETPIFWASSTGSPATPSVRNLRRFPTASLA
jgi:hypothetical protein